MERKLEQGLEESMAGSDPVSVTQPSKTKHHEKKGAEEPVSSCDLLKNWATTGAAQRGPRLNRAQ
jgi:hypothetical protein